MLLGGIMKTQKDKFKSIFVILTMVLANVTFYNFLHASIESEEVLFFIFIGLTVVSLNWLKSILDNQEL